MKNLYIGSKFFGHDSAIFVIFPDTKKIFAMETERITRYKHDNIYPLAAINKMLEQENIDVNKVENVYFSNGFISQKTENIRKNEYELEMAYREHYAVSYKKDLFDSYMAYNKKNILKKIFSLSFSNTGRYILKNKVFLKLGLDNSETIDCAIKKNMRKIFPNADIHVSYCDHQLAHALAAYYTSSFDEALLITSDGWGDEKCSAVYIVKDNNIELFSESKGGDILLKTQKGECLLGASVGGVYGYITELYGFFAGSDEGKIEALATFGDWDNEIYYALMNFTKINRVEKKIEVDAEKMSEYFEYDKIKKIINKYQREDVAAAAQKYLEDIHLEYIDFIVRETGINNVCFAGGVAANVILNLGIYEKITKNIHISPAMADDGTAQGAAIKLLLDRGNKIKDLFWLKSLEMPYYSSKYKKEAIVRVLNDYDDEVSYKYLGNTWPEDAAKMIVDGKIGALFHGRMEWGPRALGNRSLIADPRRKDFRKLINLTIKKRPEFQPFCPSILLEEKDRLFEKAYNNKHMTCAFRMKKKYWEKLPGAIHIDGTSRVQFVEKKDNEKYYRLLKKVKDLTGFGVVINTSFNKHGRTIVESPHDAIRDFLDTNMYFLIIEGYLVKKRID